jgi:ATP-dependent helicase/DNAse subunit B
MSFIVCNESFRNNYGKIGFEELIDNIVENANTSDFYFVAATNQLASSFKLFFADLLYERKRKPLVNFKISNLEGLIKQVFNTINKSGAGKILSDAYKFLIFEEAFNRVQLNFFKQGEENVSLYVIKWLSQIIFGLKEDGITIENFEKEIVKESDQIINLPKFLDTKLLFEEYQALLEESGLYDIVDATYFASKWLNENFGRDTKANGKSFIPKFENGTAFIFFGFFDFKIPELDFISALAKYDNPIAIYLDFDDTNGPLFGNYKDLILNFKQHGLQLIELEPEKEDTNTNFLKKYLFNNLFGETKPELAETIRICAVENRYEEAKQIAKLCKYLIVEKGYKPSEICITTKNPRSYASLFREVFQDVSVPVNITERFQLSSSPLVLSILSALDVVAKGFRLSDLRKVLLSFYFKFIDVDGEELDIENFLDVATKMKGLGGEELGGRKYWQRRFENRLKAIDERIEYLSSLTYSDPVELKNLEREKSQIESTMRDYNILLQYFNFDNKNLTVEDFYNIIVNKIVKQFGVLETLQNVVINLLDSISPLDKYDKIARIEEVEKDSRALSKFLELLEEFVFLTSKWYGTKMFTLSELIELFKVVIFEERYQISKKPNYGVTITSIEQTRGIPYKVMILCGAVDGEFPTKYLPEKFLGKKLGKSEKRHFENERLEFFFFLSNNSKLFDQNQRLTYIFYPKRDSKFEFVPSPFIFSLLDLIGERKSEVLFALSKVNSDNLPKGLEWVNVIPSKVERNINLKNIEEGLPDRTYLSDVMSIYLGKNENNVLEGNKLTPEAHKRIVSLTSQPISISFLEEYNKCPYLFFVDRILNISEPTVSIELFLTNREKGEILHLIVSHFYKRLAEKSLENKDYPYILRLGEKTFVPVRLSPERKEEYFTLIEQITKSVLNKFNTEMSLFEIDIEEFISSDPQRIGLVQIWLNYELKRAHWDYLPTLFEFGFGLKNKDSYEPMEIQINANEKVYLRGIIDRVDTYFNGEDLEIAIVDYKLSSFEARTWNDVFKGISFQMPFYAIVMKEILGKYYPNRLKIVNMLYQIFDFTKEKQNNNELGLNYQKMYVDENSSLFQFFFPNRKHNKQCSSEFLEESLTIAKEIVSQTLHQMKTIKNFPVQPNPPRVCDYCNFYSICKIE